jgi:DNA-binding NarL/FixJ family response regulator
MIMDRRMRILLADDHTLLLQAFQTMLRAQFDVVGAVGDGDSLVQAAQELAPDVVVADISMPGLNGLQAAQKLLTQQPALRIVFLTMNEDAETAAQAFRIGASGFVLKSDTGTELADAIEAVARGHQYLSKRIAGGNFTALMKSTALPAAQLTPREREVTRLLASGLSMPKIAIALGITPRTVAFHKYRAMEALGVHSGAELIALATRRHLI